MERKQYQVIEDSYDYSDDGNDYNDVYDHDDHDDNKNYTDYDNDDDIDYMITTMMTIVQVGETAHLSCSVQRSSPPSLLSWYINDEPVCITTIITITIIIVSILMKMSFIHLQ